MIKIISISVILGILFLGCSSIESIIQMNENVNKMGSDSIFSITIIRNADCSGCNSIRIKEHLERSKEIPGCQHILVIEDINEEKVNKYLFVDLGLDSIDLRNVTTLSSSDVIRSLGRKTNFKQHTSFYIQYNFHRQKLLLVKTINSLEKNDYDQ